MEKQIMINISDPTRKQLKDGALPSKNPPVKSIPEQQTCSRSNKALEKLEESKLSIQKSLK